MEAILYYQGRTNVCTNLGVNYGSAPLRCDLDKPLVYEQVSEWTRSNRLKYRLMVACMYSFLPRQEYIYHLTDCLSLMYHACFHSTEKADGMFATIIIVLPSKYFGAALHLSHRCAIYMRCQ
jgi:hypothetical protein